MEDTISVLIVEDEARQRQRLKKLVTALEGFTVIGTSADGQQALKDIGTLKPDLVLLDIQMPEMTGLDVAERLDPEDMPAIIFVTAYDQYALQAFEVQALDYLLKPFDDERFEAVMARAATRIRQGQVEVLGRRLMGLLQQLNALPEETGEAAPSAPTSYLDRLAIKTNGRVLLLRAENIDWIEGAGVYVELHAGKKRHLLRQSLRYLEEHLNPERFVRIHRSTIVNVERVQELIPHFHGEYIVVLSDGTRLKLSRTYRDRLGAILGEEA